MPPQESWVWGRCGSGRRPLRGWRIGRFSTRTWWGCYTLYVLPFPFYFLVQELIVGLQPDEHKYAVYAPLFAPVSVPIVVALLKELKRWRWKRKARAAVKTTPAAVVATT
jgi:hypothetical protein